MTKKLTTVEIYTDGACKGNPGPGGWGALLKFGNVEKMLKGGENNTTNNRMELLAAIKALTQLKRVCHVNLFTDSQYLKNGITQWVHQWQKNGWKTTDKKAIKNKDLWEELYKLTLKHHIVWHWVKSHAGHKENEIADKLANEAIDKMT